MQKKTLFYKHIEGGGTTDLVTENDTKGNDVAIEYYITKGPVSAISIDIFTPRPGPASKQTIDIPIRGGFADGKTFIVVKKGQYAKLNVSLSTNNAASLYLSGYFLAQ